MHWSTFGDFVYMGGYGPYVWGAYAVTLALLVADALRAARRCRRALARAADGR